MPVQAKNLTTVLTSLADQSGSTPVGTKDDAAASDFAAHLGAALMTGQAKTAAPDLSLKDAAAPSANRGSSRGDSLKTSGKRAVAYVLPELPALSMPIAPTVPTALAVSNAFAGRTDSDQSLTKAASQTDPKIAAERAALTGSRTLVDVSADATSSSSSPGSPTALDTFEQHPDSGASDAKSGPQAGTDSSSPGSPTALDTFEQHPDSGASDAKSGPQAGTEMTAGSVAISASQTPAQASLEASIQLADAAPTVNAAPKQQMVYSGASDGKAAPQASAAATSGPVAAASSQLRWYAIDTGPMDNVSTDSVSKNFAESHPSTDRVGQHGNDNVSSTAGSAAGASVAGKSSQSLQGGKSATTGASQDSAQAGQPQSGPSLSKDVLGDSPSTQAASQRDSDAQQALVQPSNALARQAGKENEPEQFKADAPSATPAATHATSTQSQATDAPAGRIAPAAPTLAIGRAPETLAPARVASLKVDLNDGGSAHATIRERGGEIDVKIVTPNSDSARHVANEVGALRRSLDDAGLKLRSAEVAYRSDGQGRSEREDPRNNRQEPRANSTSTEVFTLKEVNQ